MECIKWLLEITEGELNHELLLYVKKLWELGINPFPYIVPIIPRSLTTELVRSKHFTLVDLLKPIPGAEAGLGQEPQAEITERAFISFVQLDQSSLIEQDSQPAPQATKKKRKKEKKVGQIKAADVGL